MPGMSKTWKSGMIKCQRLVTGIEKDNPAWAAYAISKSRARQGLCAHQECSTPLRMRLDTYDNTCYCDTRYCSSECQHLDWKFHESFCVFDRSNNGMKELMEKCVEPEAAKEVAHKLTLVLNIQPCALEMPLADIQKLVHMGTKLLYASGYSKEALEFASQLLDALRCAKTSVLRDVSTELSYLIEAICSAKIAAFSSDPDPDAGADEIARANAFKQAAVRMLTCFSLIADHFSKDKHACEDHFAMFSMVVALAGKQKASGNGTAKKPVEN